MNVTGIAEVVAFGLSAFIAVAGALGVTTTMSMFRSGIFLMASFIGVAGLFILLSADLLSLLQIMMYIGGMLVMILFMVLFMPDPGGAMMAAMPGMMSPVERFFSRGLAQADLEGGDPAALQVRMPGRSRRVGTEATTLTTIMRTGIRRGADTREGWRTWAAWTCPTCPW